MVEPFEPVNLVHPDGERTYTATTITEYNSLVYGHGYEPRSPEPAAPQEQPKAPSGPPAAPAFTQPKAAESGDKK